MRCEVNANYAQRLFLLQYSTVHNILNMHNDELIYEVITMLKSILFFICRFSLALIVIGAGCIAALITLTINLTCKVVYEGWVRSYLYSDEQEKLFV